MFAGALRCTGLAGIAGIAGLLAGCAVATGGNGGNGAVQPADTAQPIKSCAQAGTFPVAIEKRDISAPDGRVVPFEIIRPDKPGTYPFLIFSHGANASPDRYLAMLHPIAAAGYIVAAPMHMDSEDMQNDVKPDREKIWLSRGEDIMLGLSRPASLSEQLAKSGIAIDADRIGAIGHSYGALLVQLVGGAKSGMPTPLVRDPQVRAIVAYSPPGALPPMMKQSGWASMAVPSLTITGTADILPGFADDWRVRRQAFDNAPQGSRSLWIGKDIDHYFGGVFGREKPADDNSKALFDRSIATSIAFFDRHLDVANPCAVGPAIEGETLIED